MQENKIAQEIMEKTKVSGKAQTSKKRVPTQNLLSDRLKGLTYQDIAKKTGYAPPTVWQRLKPYIEQIDNHNIAKGKEGELYRFKAFEAISYITPEKLKKSTAYQLTLIAGLLHDHAMKCEGTYKGDIDIALINVDMARIRLEREALYKRLHSTRDVHNTLAPTPGGEKSALSINSLGSGQGTHGGQRKMGDCVVLDGCSTPPSGGRKSGEEDAGRHESYDGGSVIEGVANTEKATTAEGS